MRTALHDSLAGHHSLFGCQRLPRPLSAAEGQDQPAELRQVREWSWDGPFTSFWVLAHQTFLSRLPLGCRVHLLSTTPLQAGRSRALATASPALTYNTPLPSQLPDAWAAFADILAWTAGCSCAVGASTSELQHQTARLQVSTPLQALTATA